MRVEKLPPGKGLQSASDGSSIASGMRASLLFEAGRLEELDALESRSGAARYYQAVTRARRGDLAGAAGLLEGVGAADPMRGPADRLLGWVRLQQALEHQTAGREEEALASLLQAVALWPGSDGPADALGSPEHWPVQVCLAMPLRERARRLLEDAARERGPADPRACHNLALFHLAEGDRRARAGDFGAAVAEWHRSIAYLCVPLSDPRHMRDWVGQRGRDYETAPGSEAALAVQTRAFQVYETLFAGWAETLRSRGRAAEAERLAELALALRAEHRAAEVLRDLGGLPALGGGAAGPLFVTMMGLAEPLAARLSSLQVKQSRKRPEAEVELGLLGALAALLEADQTGPDTGGIEPAKKEEAQRLFSGLRFACVLEREGHLAEALDYLREAKRSCGLFAGEEGCSGPIREACGRSAASFARCNPAFADEGGPARFREAALAFEPSLLLRLGEEAIASTEGSITGGLDYWQEALELAPAGGQRDAVAADIRQKALGRAKTLERALRRGSGAEQGGPAGEESPFDEAITLMDGVNDLCGDSQVRGVLSTLLTARGIDLGNKEHWTPCVRDLRKARLLNPHSPHTNRNLVVALRNWAGALRDTDTRQAIELLREARGILEECLARDPNHQEFQELHRSTVDNPGYPGGGFGDAGPGGFMEQLLAQTPEGARQVAASYQARAMARHGAGDIPGAISLLERSLEFAPRNDTTRDLLARMCNQYGVKLANEQQFDSALQYIERGLRARPRDTTLQRNKREIAAARDLWRSLGGGPGGALRGLFGGDEGYK